MSDSASYLAFVASVPRLRAAAGALLRDHEGRVLVVHPVYKDDWDIPGGIVEAGESPVSALLRELQEELGIAPLVGGLACVDWVPPAPPWDAGLMFVFNAGVLTDSQIATLRLQPEELDEYAFVRPADLDKLLLPGLARRMNAAISAADAGRTAYLEDGLRRLRP
ncbi:NUDIX hydrolase [Sphaerisporangium siamense]|uniref:8-oxo-dGTP pyrophosphatase MutT (NUDIX family) n=1 Tax=Sphaerisporangium siamense TaxID=795645 RepID=A0A7W7GDM4_9ACTN|nr:NUDIX hydrolase [Sphaerisporangium siamense]MBB4705757.1 8-oxo-dGTP pyrophosphatase MutT (NUDIX family) [Sphaerisporangium siamense]GII82856.1 NUDIX hydrolase [Sphaerisporangium siamense]